MNSDYLITTRNGRSVYQHRLVWERENGPIPKGFHVHHKNGDKRDNRIENLELLSGFEHHSHHFSELGATEEHKERGRKQMKRIWDAKPLVDLVCQECGKKFQSRGNNKGLPRACSGNCSSKIYYKERGRARYFERQHLRATHG